MAKFFVFCALPNASASINGIAFVPAKGSAGGVVSAESLEEDAAAAFSGIPGYSVVDEDVVNSKTKSKKPALAPDALPSSIPGDES